MIGQRVTFRTRPLSDGGWEGDLILKRFWVFTRVRYRYALATEEAVLEEGLRVLEQLLGK